ncbi:E3 ubiquitin-protein ligase RNF170-like [Arapaima gigas]
MYVCHSIHTGPTQYYENERMQDCHNEYQAHPTLEQLRVPDPFSNGNYCKDFPQYSLHGCPKDLQCPVCLQTASFPVSTNCGHLFCAPCLIAYWRNGSWLAAISCPLCRQRVSILYHLFRESRRDRQQKQVLGDIRDYNKRFSGARWQVTDYLYDLPLFLLLFLRGLGNMGGLVGFFFLRVTVCCFRVIISLASPVNAVPEPFCGILGLIDDLVVVFLLLICMINIGQQIQPQRVAVTQSTTQGIFTDSL